MTERRLLKVGIIGAVAAALCCFTPALVVLLGLLGLSALADAQDQVLLAALLFFALIIYALMRKGRAAAARPRAGDRPAAALDS